MFYFKLVKKVFAFRERTEFFALYYFVFLCYLLHFFEGRKEESFRPPPPRPLGRPCLTNVDTKKTKRKRRETLRQREKEREKECVCASVCVCAREK